jgi:hypothetical protein
LGRQGRASAGSGLLGGLGLGGATCELTLSTDKTSVEAFNQPTAKRFVCAFLSF